jgi:uncharacterized C2H2 Zn-finger protein
MDNSLKKELLSILNKIEKIPIRWDRLVEIPLDEFIPSERKDETHRIYSVDIYGWISRTDGKEDFIYLMIRINSNGYQQYRFGTSSAKYTNQIAHLLGFSADEHHKCIPFAQYFPKNLETPLGNNLICPECHKKFQTERSLLQHSKATGHVKKIDGSINISVPPQKVVECSACHKQFPTERALEQHMNATGHTKKLKCPKCKKEFTSQQSLSQHINSPRHNPDAPQGLSAYRKERQLLIQELKEKKKKRLESDLKDSPRIHYTRNVVYDPPKLCPPHDFVVTEQQLVGFGPGNGGEQRTEEGVERCQYCGKTRFELEGKK